MLSPMVQEQVAEDTPVVADLVKAADENVDLEEVQTPVQDRMAEDIGAFPAVPKEQAILDRDALLAAPSWRTYSIPLASASHRKKHSSVIPVCHMRPPVHQSTLGACHLL